MALDIVSGYNAEFKTFVEFAQKAHADGYGYNSAVAKATVSSRMFTVTSVDPSRVGLLSRRSSDEIANDATRARFKAAVADMFGGVSKIPGAVKEAMILNDYGRGRPLTARRILAVKEAVDANIDLLVAKGGGAQAKATATFQSPEVEAAARAMGFTKAELPKIALATRFYAEIAGMDEMDAMREVAKHGTKANLLAFCGERFLDDMKSFADGLKLIDSFREWYGELQPYCKQHDGANVDASADTPTKFNPTHHITGNEKSKKGLELLIFQDIATDPDFNLKRSGEDAFGYANNAAMRFYGRGMVDDTMGRIFNVPPEKRRILFAATDAFMPLFQTVEEANLKKGNPNLWKIGLPRFFTARMLNHIDELGDLMAQGKLSTKSIIKMCFPDMDKTGDYDLKALNTWFQKIVDSVEPRPDDPEGASFVQQRMDISGCTLAEAKKAYNDSVLPPDCAYHAGYNCYFGDLPLGGLALMKADMCRGYNYNTVDLETGEKNKDDFILPPEDVQQTVRFQDGKVLRLHSARKEELDRNLGELEQRLRDLCGEGHEFQMNIVGYCLSQSGNEPMKNTLRRFGVFASEHAVLDYSISKDAETGAIAIRYASPPGLPISFSWTCRVNTDGTCVTTPLVVVDDMKPVEMTPAKARSMVVDSAKLLGEKGLAKNVADQAASYLMQHGNGLPAKTVRILSNYIVNNLLRNDEGLNEQSLEILARDMKTWREFDFCDRRLNDIGRKIAQHQNDYLKGTLDDYDQYSPENPNVFQQLYTDAERGEFVMNGKKFKVGSKQDDVVNEFLSVVKDPKARKAVSTLFNQGGLSDVQLICGKSTIGVNDEEQELYDIKGSELFVSKDMKEDLVAIVSDGDTVRYALDVAKDGMTATITLTTDKNLTANGEKDKEHFIGTATISQRSVIDLTKDVPEVIDVTFSQTFSDKIVNVPVQPPDEAEVA